MIPERICWAVETLQISPDDSLLEIGCGHGVAVSLIAEKLATGKIIAIDRSEKAIQTAIQRNKNHLAAGKVEFHTTSLHEVDFGDSRFNKIFAVNVNVFWLTPAKELAVLKNLLTPNGILYLFYEPPASKAQEIADKVSSNFQAGGFAVQNTLFRELLSTVGVCIIGRPIQPVGHEQYPSPQ
ncbi:MAG: class I SAM-dependent methyltransferase [Anaerolineae bacterium]|nr:class I SAM-dependent methyltransferase [Anaerolineae bacterium]